MQREHTDKTSVYSCCTIILLTYALLLLHYCFTCLYKYFSPAFLLYTYFTYIYILLLQE